MINNMKTNQDAIASNEKPNARTLAASPEKMRGAEKEGEGRGAPFLSKFLLIAGIACAGASASCEGPTSGPADQDADVQDVEDADGNGEAEDAGPEIEADAVEAESDSDAGETLETVDGEDEGSEAVESCPTTASVEEPVESPGPIGEIEQAIIETYEVTTECDGTETRGNLLELEIALASPASPEQLDAAISAGSDTVIFGERVRLTALGTALMEFAILVPGADATVYQLGSVTDGTNTVTVQGISETEVTLRVDGGYVHVPAGGYYPLSDGRVVMVAAINYFAMNPLRSTCRLTILEAPTRVNEGENLAHGGADYQASMPDDGTNLLSVRLVRM